MSNKIKVKVLKVIFKLVSTVLQFIGVEPECPSLLSLDPTMLATLWFTPGREGQGGCEQSDVVFDSVSCCSSEYKIRVLCEVEGGGRDSWSCWEREECNLLCCQQTPVVCVCASYVTTVYKINVNRDNVCPSRVYQFSNNLRFMWGLLRPS